MKTDNKPNRANSRSYLQELILPTTADFLLYTLLGGLLLVAFNAKEIWNYFNSDVLEHQSIGQILGVDDKFHNFITNVSQGRALQVLFWALVGIIAYIVIWFLRNILVNLRNDIVADEYLHPPSYSRASYWSSVIGHKVFFGLMVLLLAGYIIAGFNLLMALATTCQAAVEDFSLPHSAVMLLGSWFITVILLHILVVLTRITITSWRRIYMDL